MKKVFVEPEMQIIELNLNENIASSTQDDDYYIRFLVQIHQCLVVNTGKYENEVTVGEAFVGGCINFSQMRSIGVSVPLDEVRPFMRPDR